MEMSRLEDKSINFSKNFLKPFKIWLHIQLLFNFYEITWLAFYELK